MWMIMSMMGKAFSASSILWWNMWITNASNNSIFKITQLWVVTTFSWTWAYPMAIAFDWTNMWTANYTWGSVTKVSPIGVMTTYTGISWPRSIAFDWINMWTANYNWGSVTKVSPTGVMTTYPVWLALRSITFDGVNMWISWSDSFWNPLRSILYKITPTWVVTSYPIIGRSWYITFDWVDLWITSSGIEISRVSLSWIQTVYTWNDVWQSIVYDWSNIWYWGRSWSTNGANKISLAWVLLWTADWVWWALWIWYDWLHIWFTSWFSRLYRVNTDFSWLTFFTDSAFSAWDTYPTWVAYDWCLLSHWWWGS